MRRNVKKEKQTDKGDASAEPVRTKVAGVARDESADVESNQPNREEDAADRRVLRSKYLAVMTKIGESPLLKQEALKFGLSFYMHEVVYIYTRMKS
ncbi:hypothetical protein ES288_D01G221700v1 [Gossypium darwinii]|uniref:Uncharacterized protein n=1 Tax=Gossypium darwinii TaxID=34276 RepID=A0A5D2DSJ6_GOSDA|nr:hypothetical protein ES288_D01G221700v1 [Gossypium darwinii]